MSADKRTAQRYPVEVAAEVELDGQVLVAATQNISNGGVGLVLDRPLAEGTRLELMLFLTQDGIEDPDEEPFETPGTVRWAAEQEAGKHIAGVRFEAVDDAQRAQLERFVAALNARA